MAVNYDQRSLKNIFFFSRMNFGDQSWPCFQVMLKIEMKAFDFGEEINPLHVENDAKWLVDVFELVDFRIDIRGC